VLHSERSSARIPQQQRGDLENSIMNAPLNRVITFDRVLLLVASGEAALLLGRFVEPSADNGRSDFRPDVAVGKFTKGRTWMGGLLIIARMFLTVTRNRARRPEIATSRSIVLFERE
jgi:hypothetical protein